MPVFGLCGSIRDKEGKISVGFIDFRVDGANRKGRQLIDRLSSLELG